MDSEFALTGFVMDELIGFGASGDVWRAHDAVTGETVALKRLRRRGPAATERLRREAAILAALSGPHILGVRQLVVSGDEAVLVLDYAAGGSLAGVLAARGRLPAPEVVTILAPLATALAAAHSRSLVHADITPANILFTAEGRPLLADFGVAHALGSLQVVEGTVDYLDPAVASGALPTTASDVFALAAVGFAALAGQPLWGSGDPSQIQARASIGVRPALEELAPDVPAALVAAVESALRLDPDERPDAATFANAVLRASAAAPVRLVVLPAAAPSSMTGPMHPLAATPGASAKTPEEEWPRSAPFPTWVRGLSPWRLRLVVFIGAAISVLAAGFGGMLLGHHGGEQAQTIDLGPLRSAAISHDHAHPSGPAWQRRVAQLDALRAEAFARGDSQLLASVYAPGVAAYSTDLATVTSLVSRGLRARGFSATVGAVTPQSGTATTEKLLVEDRLSSYVLVNAAGSVVGRGAARGERLFTMSLSNLTGRWLITAIAPL
jgi:tRNA A-37 threonylcarbamoyl transferase component Bud32